MLICLTCHDFFMFNKRQILQLEVFDFDKLTADDALGSARVALNGTERGIVGF